MADHLVDIVDDNDEVIGQAMKSKKIEQGFISRVVAIFLMRPNGKMVVCKRAEHKKNAAGKYDLAAFGNVMQGESYPDAAQRELEEELHIICPLTPLQKFYQEVHNDGMVYKIFCGIFVGTTDAALQLNEELVEAKEMSIDEVQDAIAQHPDDFCAGFINDFTQVQNQLKTYCK